MNKQSWIALPLLFTMLAAGCTGRERGNKNSLLPDHAVADTDTALVRQFSSGNIKDITTTQKMIAADPQRYLPVAQEALVKALLDQEPTAIANLFNAYGALAWRGHAYRGLFLALARIEYNGGEMGCTPQQIDDNHRAVDWIVAREEFTGEDATILYKESILRISIHENSSKTGTNCAYPARKYHELASRALDLGADPLSVSREDLERLPDLLTNENAPEAGLKEKALEAYDDAAQIMVNAPERAVPAPRA